MPTEFSITMRRDLLGLPDDARISSKHLPATHIHAKAVELRTTLPRLAEVFVFGDGVRISDEGREYTGPISVHVNDILSIPSPVSREDLYSITCMGKELSAIRRAVGIDN